MFMIIELLRQKIKSCGKSRYRISQECDISESQLSKIMAGKTVRAEAIDILLEYFGLTIIERETTRKAERKNGKQ